jgi:hypothetical protein
MPNFDLSKWQKDYESAPAEREERDDVPDGNYQVRVARAEMKESKQGNPMLNWELDILGPRYANRKLWRNNVLASAENIKYLKSDLYICGVQLQNLNDINRDDVRTKLIGVTLEVTVKTKGENRNVYFNKRIQIAAPQQGTRPAAYSQRIGDDDVPF